MTIKQILSDSRAMLGDRKGATAIEYGLIAAGIAVLLVAAISTLGGDLVTTFTDVSNGLTGGGGGG